MLESKTILLALGWQDHRLYKGLTNYASRNNWHIPPHQVSGHVSRNSWPADGAIVCYDPSVSELVQSLDMPKVNIGVEDLPEPMPRVTVDNEEVGRLAARHFLDRGFKNFCYYSWPGIAVNALRKKTFFDALIKEGVPEQSLYEIFQPPYPLLEQWDLSQEYILNQLRELPRPLAVFSGHDSLGAVVVEVCLCEGIQVPEEISVLGVDNLEHICEGLSVPLSTIDVNLEEIGYTAARQLDRLMKKEISVNEPPVRVPPKGIICRQSSNTLAVPHPKVIRALQFIEAHCSEPITMENICNHADMSKRGMEKAFLRHLGISPSAHLRRIRLANAKRMLAETDEKVSTIAHECGYSNSSNLSSIFRRETGITPREYRTRHSNS